MPRMTQGIGLALVAAVLALAAPSTAMAQGSDLAARAAARDLGTDGVKAYQAGDYGLASERLSRAYQLLKAPSLGYWLGRTWVQQGKLVEASELFLEVTRLSVSGGDATVQQKAQKDAAAEREVLQRRIAKLGIVLTGPSSSNAKVTLDTREVPKALLGVQSPVNPGRHAIVVRSADGTTTNREVTLAEGGAHTITIQLDASSESPPPIVAGPFPPTSPAVPAASGSSVPGAAPGPPVPNAAPSPPATGVATAPPATGVATAASPQAASPRRVPQWVGYTAMAVGGTGIAAGTIVGLMARSRLHSSPLSDSCTESRCSPRVINEASSYNRLRTYSMVGFGVGALGVIAGAVVLWALPSPKSQEKPIAIDFVTTRDTQQVTVHLDF